MAAGRTAEDSELVLQAHNIDIADIEAGIEWWSRSKPGLLARRISRHPTRMSNSSRDEFYVSGADTFHNSHLRIARPRSAVPSETSILGPARMQGRSYIERTLAFSAIARASQSSLVDFHTVSGHNRFESLVITGSRLRVAAYGPSAFCVGLGCTRGGLTCVCARG